MTAKRQWQIVAAIVGVIAAAVWGTLHFYGDQFSPITVGSVAPDFRGVTLDSEPSPKSLADYKGQVVLVNIWATWCLPCEREMPMLQRLAEEYKAKGFRIVAVSVDSPGMERVIRDFIQRYGLTFDVLYDADARIKLDYTTTGIPESFIVAKDGVIRYQHVGPIEENDAVQVRALLDRLLAEPRE